MKKLEAILTNQEINPFSDNKQSTKKEVDKADSIYEKIAVEQSEWTSNISELTKMFFDISKIPELQVYLFSYRQMLIEKKAYIYSVINKLNKKIKNLKKDIFIKLKTDGSDNINLKYNNDINIFVDSNLSNNVERLNLFESHFEFLQSSIETVDRMIFGVKNRIQIEELKNIDKGF